MHSLRGMFPRVPYSQQTSIRLTLNDETQTNTDPLIVNSQDTLAIKIPNMPSRTSMSNTHRYIRRGLVVRISAFHAGGPGSIPGVGIYTFFSSSCFCSFLLLLLLRRKMTSLRLICLATEKRQQPIFLLSLSLSLSRSPLLCLYVECTRKLVHDTQYAPPIQITRMDGSSSYVNIPMILLR
jgi:hypothetical protein